MSHAHARHRKMTTEHGRIDGDVGRSARPPCTTAAVGRASILAMELRIRGLADHDPRSVLLPHGTEITTRVDRTIPDRDRVVPQGTVGRIVGLDAVAETVDVSIVGIGVVRYRRDEVLPRRSGQIRFANRRAAAWGALVPCVVLEAVVGSRAWGLDDAASDVDLRGIFALPFSWTSGLAEPPTDLVREDGSATYWEVEKAIRQALRADPNTLELLFVDGVRATDEIGHWILEARDAFVSTEIHGSFARYALSQLDRLGQAARLARHRSEILAWLRAEDLDLDQIAARLSKIDPRAATSDDERLRRAKEGVKQLYRSLYDQGLLAARDLPSLVAFARSDAAGLELPRELRPKNAYNLLRLLSTAKAWLETGRADLVVRGPLRDRLLAIKRGEVALDEVLAEAETLAPALDEARRSSPLPARPDLARADALLRRIRHELARRAVSSTPGPFGQDAPPPPAAIWEE